MSDQERDDEFRNRVVEVLRRQVKDGLAVAVFEQVMCAVCVDCDAILHALPAEVPAPSAAIYEHTCVGGDA